MSEFLCVCKCWSFDIWGLKLNALTAWSYNFRIFSVEFKLYFCWSKVLRIWTSERNITFKKDCFDFAHPPAGKLSSKGLFSFQYTGLLWLRSILWTVHSVQNFPFLYFVLCIFASPSLRLWVCLNVFIIAWNANHVILLLSVVL